MKTLEVRRLGRCGYVETVPLQEELVQRRRAGQVGDTLLLLEHDPVITVGRGSRGGATAADSSVGGASSPDVGAVAGGIGAGSPSHDGIWLPPNSIPIVETSRGGQATYHGPGQLVLYPILDLRQWQCDLHWYLRELEQVIIDAVGELGLAGERADGYTGVWLGGHKIASIGVAVRGWITYHGVALNVTCDLAGFSVISPCGLPADAMTSLAAQGVEVTVRDVMPLVERAFRQTFGFV